MYPRYVINCLGMGSKKVFGDSSMYGAKGYLLEYKNRGKIRWGIYGFSMGMKRIKVYFLPDRILATVLEKLDEDTPSIDPNKVK